MRKKVTFIILSVLLINFMPMQVRAAGDDVFYEQDEEAEIEVTGLFDTRYVVKVDQISARTGPGEGYSVTCTLYKGYVISVSSISNGWAKFKLRGQWNYVPANSIERE